MGYTAICNLGFDTENKRKVALKILKHNLGLKASKAIMAEKDSLTKLSHPNIIKIFDVQENAELIRRDKSKRSVNFMALELAENGELFEYVSTTGPFSERVARFYF